MAGVFEYSANWIIFKRDGISIYGFLVKEKGTELEKEKDETDYENLTGNKQGNAFITTQINYEGNGSN